MAQTQAFGPFQLIRRISIGGMAEVFQARDTRNGSLVAVKRILPSASEDEDFLAMFQDEARIVSTLEHTHIARCLDYGQIGGVWYIAFEYVDGRDLRAVIDRAGHGGEPPPLSFSLYVISRIGEGLAYAHARKMANGQPVELIHRDVSPQNIVISFDGDVKLIDFGIAKAAGRLVRTRSGTIKGKLGYMSPEQVRGQTIDQRSDVFSLGICAWELLTLTRLFYAESEIRMIQLIREGRVPPPSQAAHKLAGQAGFGIPAELDRIVLKALANQPDERYRGAREFYKEVNALAETLTQLATREQIAQYMRRAFAQTPAAEAPAEFSGHSAVTRGQETGSMAADKQAGSDLDVFEGLAKKTTKAPPAGGTSRPGASPSVPPPPPAAPRGGDLAKKTLMGMPNVGASAPQPAKSVPPPAPGRTQPPPPPGRALLPAVTAPPAKGRASMPPPKGASTESVPAAGASTKPPPPPVTTKPPPAAVASSAHGLAGAPGQTGVVTSAAAAPAPTAVSIPPAAKAPAVDLEWGDDDEATHIFDKDDQAQVIKGAADAAAGRAAPQAMVPAAGTPFAKATLVGMSQPAAVTRTMPPPAVTSAVPPPAQTNTSFPPPAFPAPSNMGGNLAPSATGASARPGPSQVPTEYAQQVRTVPMSMPGSQTGSRPPPIGVPTSPPYGGSPMDIAIPGAPGLPRGMDTTAVVHPIQRSPMLMWAAAAIAAAAGIGVAYVVLAPAKPAQIRVTATDGKGTALDRAEVSIDGKTTSCDNLPCSVTLTGGMRHTVKVTVAGFDTPVMKDITPGSGEAVDVALKFEQSSAKPTGLKVTGGAQKGVSLFVDGREVGPLPQEVKDLTPGDHQLKLEGTDHGADHFAGRYIPFEKTVVVAKNEVLELPAQPLKVKSGEVTVNVDTQGAKAFLVSGADRRVLDKNPITVRLDPEKPYTIEATKTGFQDWKQAITFEDGQADKSVTITLEPKGAPAPAAYVAPQPAPVAQQAPAPQPRPVAKEPAPAPAAAEAEGEGFLNINSIPPSNCFLDGKLLGSTPKLHQSVKPGSHTVKFVNSELSLTKTVTVSVGNAETKTAAAKLY